LHTRARSDASHTCERPPSRPSKPPAQNTLLMEMLLTCLMLASRLLGVLTARAAPAPQTTTPRSRRLSLSRIQTHDWPRDACAPLSVNRCCVPAQPALPYRANGPLPTAAAVVRARPSPRCHLRAGMPARADPDSVQRQLADEAAPPCARTLSAAVRCSERHCAAVAEMLTGIPALATSPLVARCV